MAKFCTGCGKELGFFTKKIKVSLEEGVQYYCQPCHQDKSNEEVKSSQREEFKTPKIDKVQDESDMTVSPPGAVFTVNLIDPGAGLISCIKVIRGITGLGLKESKDMAVAGARIPVYSNAVDPEVLKKLFEAAGCVISIEKPEKPSNIEPFLSSDSNNGLFLVRLTDVGEKKISVIKEIRQITGLGLKESKEITDKLSTIITNLTGEQAREVAAKLNRAGAKTEIVESK